MASNSLTQSTGKFSVLRQHPIFRELDQSAFDQLCRYAKLRLVKRSTTIFSKGDPGNSLFAVVSGTVKIGVTSADGREAVFNIVGPGELVGEIALLDGGKRTADAIASTNCEILVIERREFLPFVKSQPVLAMKLIDLLCARLRWISDHVEQIVIPNLPGRLAKALVRLLEKENRDDGKRKVTITQLELGQMVGMSRESINKQLRTWANQKLVRLERGGITLLDKAALEELALGDPESARSSR